MKIQWNRFDLGIMILVSRGKIKQFWNVIVYEKFWGRNYRSARNISFNFEINVGKRKWMSINEKALADVTILKYNNTQSLNDFKAGHVDVFR